MPHPHEALTEFSHDRLGIRRSDTAWCDAQWAGGTSRVLVIAGTRIRPTETGIDWVSPADAPEGTRVLLGERDGVAYFAVIIEPLADSAAAEGWVPLRALLPALVADNTDAPFVLHALGMAEWLAVTHFCPRCGRPLSPRKEGHELACENDHVTFPRTDPAVIMLITDGEPGADDERCLLGHHVGWPAGRYSTLAGFCEPGESLEGAVRREVAEETGVTVGEVAYFGNQPWPLPASLMLGFTGRAVETTIECDLDEIADARWLTRAELRSEAEAGTLVLPGGISISRSLIEDWYGEALPGSW